MKHFPGIARYAVVASACSVVLALQSCEQSSASGSKTETSKMTDANQVELTTLRFRIEGMTCGGCVNAVTHAIQDVDGVVSCDVSLDDEQAVVKARSADVVDAVIAAVKEANFKAIHQPS